MKDEWKKLPYTSRQDKLELSRSALRPIMRHNALLCLLSPSQSLTNVNVMDEGRHPLSSVIQVTDYLNVNGRVTTR